MFDLPENPLTLLKGLWERLPSKLLVLIVVGAFLLSVIAGLLYVRNQVTGYPSTTLARHLGAGVDAALIVLIALLVVVATAAVIYTVCYRER